MPKSRPAPTADTSIVTEKMNIQKALAKKKKAHHTHIVPAPRDGAKRYRRLTNAPPRGTSTTTQLSAAGDITSESSRLPAGPTLDTTMRTREFSINDAPAVPPSHHEPSHMECESASLAAFVDRSTMITTVQKFKTLTTLSTPFSVLVTPVAGTTISGELQDRRLQDVAMGHDVFYGPDDMISRKLLRWYREESARTSKATKLQAIKKLVGSPASSATHTEQPGAADGLNDMVVVRYHPPSKVALKVARVFSRTCSTTSSLDGIWAAERIFFAAQSGHTRLVDRTQPLYNVDVLVDDGGSDFDSIASPIKLDLHYASLHPAATSSPSISSHVCSSESDLDDDLADLYQLECRFVMADYDHDRDLATPDTTLSVSSDGDVIDPLLVFCKSGRNSTNPSSSQEVYAETYIWVGSECENEHCMLMDPDVGKATGSEHPDVFIDHQGLPVASSPEYLHYDVMVEMDSGEIVEHTEHSHALESDRNDSDKEYDSDLTLFDTGRLPEVVTAYTPAHQTRDENAPHSSMSEVAFEERNTAGCSEAFPSDWASELVRTTLGTESLCTFFQYLEIDDNRTTTKVALASAFLTLVNLEREKLNKHALPKSYNALNVLASQIVPHTMFIGTTSLTSFLGCFAFDKNHSTTVSEVYRVFTALQKEDLHAQLIATTGVMGELGRSLGKLPAI
jgi:hypothetical protein